MLLTPTVTQGDYTTTNRIAAIATLSDSDTKKLLQQKKNKGSCYVNQHWDNRAITTKK